MNITSQRLKKQKRTSMSIFNWYLGKPKLPQVWLKCYTILQNLTVLISEYCLLYVWDGESAKAVPGSASFRSQVPVQVPSHFFWHGMEINLHESHSFVTFLGLVSWWVPSPFRVMNKNMLLMEADLSIVVDGFYVGFPHLQRAVLNRFRWWIVLFEATCFGWCSSREKSFIFI